VRVFLQEDEVYIIAAGTPDLLHITLDEPCIRVLHEQYTFLTHVRANVRQIECCGERLQIVLNLIDYTARANIVIFPKELRIRDKAYLNRGKYAPKIAHDALLYMMDDFFNSVPKKGNWQHEM